jgi:CRISP-associated protein Cas1
LCTSPTSTRSDCSRSFRVSKLFFSFSAIRLVAILKQIALLSLSKHKDSVAELKTFPPKTINGLLGIEGRSAQAYFNAWQGLLLRWKGNSRKPIPNDWLKFTNRTSVQIKRAQNRNASHPVNAMLNYAYAVLESRVRLEIVALRYDPMIGYLHAYDEDRAAFVFDLMEPLRPVVDHIVLDFVHAETFEPADFTIRRDGVCRLNPELTKALVRRLMATRSA